MLFQPARQSATNIRARSPRLTRQSVRSVRPIAAGDLLVSSGRSGYAMKSVPLEINGRKFHQPGTLVGKALEGLDEGTGEILVLLSLQ